MIKIIFIVGSFIGLVACSHDPIDKVLDDNENIPKSDKDRSINWYKDRPELSRKIELACNSNTIKYFNRSDCINAKSALNSKLIESNVDLSNNLRLNLDRQYLKENNQK
ncbi:hypothetical protein [Acinetobacter seifertii]|uniref:hypothetical protein n=1 Tax=Acinetobacter seifertii TaxID=1530123 RepID=UPI000A300FA9|nr:hypothetical protein [Acinetobacter seifertii]OUC57291.1 hypothetical protein MWQ_19224 [Acinetobacter seifertii]